MTGRIEYDLFNSASMQSALEEHLPELKVLKETIGFCDFRMTHLDTSPLQLEYVARSASEAIYNSLEEILGIRGLLLRTKVTEQSDDDARLRYARIECANGATINLLAYEPVINAFGVREDGFIQPLKS